MALEGKGKQVASEPTHATRASGKRRRCSGDDAEPSSPYVAAKRRHRAGVPNSVDGDPCISVEQHEDNQGVEREDHLNDDCVPGEARARQEEWRLPPGVPRVKQLAWLPRALLEHDRELIPSIPFYRQVKEISQSFSEELRWTPEALIWLRHEAEFLLVEMFEVVDNSARAVDLNQEQDKEDGEELPDLNEAPLLEGEHSDDAQGEDHNNPVNQGDEQATDVGVLGSEEYDQERPLGLQGSQEGTLSLRPIAAVTTVASMHIPYQPFERLVQEITVSVSSGCIWHPDALKSLHEINGDEFPVTVTNELGNASCNQEICVNMLWRLLPVAVKQLVSLYGLVNQSVIRVLATYIGDDTNLTPDEEQAAIWLWCGCASGIRTYIWTMKGSFLSYLKFEKKFSEQYLVSRYLGSGWWKIKLFAGDNLTPVEDKFTLTKVKTGNATLFGGWARFVRIHGIKTGDVCACIFEEEGDSLSVRVHVLRAAPMG